MRRIWYLFSLPVYSCFTSKFAKKQSRISLNIVINYISREPPFSKLIPITVLSLITAQWCVFTDNKYLKPDAVL